MSGTERQREVLNLLAPDKQDGAALERRIPPVVLQHEFVHLGGQGCQLA